MPADDSAASASRPDARKGPRGHRTLYVAVLFLCAVFLLDSLVGERGLVALLRVQREHQQLSDAVARARAENAALLEDVRRLKHDPAAIEDIARRELGLIRPGEKMFIIRDVPPPDRAR